MYKMEYSRVQTESGVICNELFIGSKHGQMTNTLSIKNTLTDRQLATYKKGYITTRLTQAGISDEGNTRIITFVSYSTLST